MKTKPPPPVPLDPPLRRPLRTLADRLIRHHQAQGGTLLEAEDLIALARAALWRDRDAIMARPDPIATSYTTARRVMWRAVQSANRRQV